MKLGTNCQNSEAIILLLETCPRFTWLVTSAKIKADFHPWKGNFMLIRLSAWTMVITQNMGRQSYSSGIIDFQVIFNFLQTLNITYF